MKKIAKLLALILALALVFALVGCESKGGDGDDDSKPSKSTSEKKDDKDDDKDDEKETASKDNEDEKETASKDDKDDDEDSIVGDWESKDDLGVLLDAMFEGSGLEEYFSFAGTELVMVLTFDDDTATLKYDEDSIESAYEAMIDAIIDGYVNAIEESFAEEGIDYTFEELLEEAGTSMDELKEDAMEECPYDDFAEIFLEFGEEYDYELDDDIIYFDDEEAGEFSGSKVIIEFGEGIVVEFTRA